MGTSSLEVALLSIGHYDDQMYCNVQQTNNENFLHACEELVSACLQYTGRPRWVQLHACVSSKMAELPKKFGETKIRDAAQWLLANRKGLLSRAVTNYRQKYILPRNAGIKPFAHALLAIMVVNYLIQYPRAKGR